MRYTWLGGLVLSCLPAMASAHSSIRVSVGLPFIGVSIGGHHHHGYCGPYYRGWYGPSVYVGPSPYYYAPPVVYGAPPVVYSPQPTVVYQTAPQYVPQQYAPQPAPVYAPPAYVPQQAPVQQAPVPQQAPVQQQPAPSYYYGQ